VLCQLEIVPKVHHEKMIKELKKIKMNLPVGVDLLVEILSETHPELYRISDTSIFLEDNYLVFSMRIP